ncbi:NUMOD4 domain-containing protein [Anaerosacchariphilus polymeriproducens]|uniref:Endonuclease n=1 Tax=Anaerosacchariphilus polymeriproducens TaxID=1812858 RepID=A0A371AQS8_9FIRM|nr:NUMOD4 domain-containing protein [Anaerosacchariphilus polymeriproducens]RDU21928.1 endonuclease [Anaerosacchariphilus polymeriproducens]
MEIWKDIEGYKGSYQVSNIGRIKSLKRVIMRSDGKEQTIKERILKPLVHTNGYLLVALYDNGKQKNMLIHRLVALTFIDNQENKQEVNHKDGNKTNNHINNLEWNTSSENKQHAYSVLNRKTNGKVISQFTKTGDYIKTYYSTYHAERETGTNQSDITKVCKGKAKTAGGCIWQYAG